MIPVDEYVRRLPLPTDAAAAARQPARRAQILECVLAEEPPTRRRRVPSRAVVVPSALVLVTSLGIGAWAVVQAVDPDQLYANCFIDLSVDGVAQPSSDDHAAGSDPVERCRQLWQARAQSNPVDESYAGPPPDMNVYTDGRGTLAVVPDGWAVPAGLTPVEGEVVIDDSRARLEAAIGDYIDGLHSRCHSGEEAVETVRNEFTRLGLEEWTVGEPPAADGTSTCAVAFVDDGRRVTFFPDEPIGPGFGGDPTASDDPVIRSAYVALAELRAAVTGAGCMSQEEAAALARSILPSGFYTEVVDDSMDCAVVDVGMGGDFLVSVYGPELATP